MLFVETLEQMRYGEANNSFQPTCSSTLAMRGIAMTIISWLCSRCYSPASRPLLLDLSKSFGQEAVTFISRNEVLSKYLRVENGKVMFSNKLSESDIEQIVDKARQMFPPDEPMYHYADARGDNCESDDDSRNLHLS